MTTTLFVERSGDELRYTLFSQTKAHLEPLAPTSRTILTEVDRTTVTHWLTELAECRSAATVDADWLKKRGSALFHLLVPDPIKARVSAIDSPLVLVTNDPTLPWELLHDGTNFLALRVPFSRRLIVDDTIQQILASPASTLSEFRVLIIADTCGNLPGAKYEAAALCEFFSSRSVTFDLVDGPGSHFDIIDHLMRSSYSIIHYCGHVIIEDIESDTSSPPKSYIPTMDGSISPELIMAYIKGSPLVFLNGCHTDVRTVEGHTPTSPEMGLVQVQGFAQAFLFGSQHGRASAVIGTSWKIPDEPKERCVDFVKAFYENVFNSKPIAEALRLAKDTIQDLGPMYWAPWVLYGDPAQTLNGLPDTAVDSHTSSFASEVRKNGKHSDESEVCDTAEVPLCPLDHGSRRVVLTAFREADATQRIAISSLHILIGLIEHEIEPLFSAIALTYDVQAVKQAASDRIKVLLPTVRDGSAPLRVTLGLSELFTFADQSARQAGRSLVSSSDLLVGVLNAHSSQAYSLLDGLGVLESILENAHSTGDQLELNLDPDAELVLERAQAIARNDGIPFIGTPHVLAGLLERDHFVRLVLEMELKSIDETIVALRQLVGRSPHKPPGNLPLRPNLHETIETAAGLATEAGRKVTSCSDLARAILHQKDTATGALLDNLSVDRERCDRRLQVHVAN